MAELGMTNDVECTRAEESDDGQVANWRVVISAWALVLIFIMLLTGARAVACLRGGLHHQHHQHLAGAVIPRHDTCGGPGIASAPGLDGCKNLPIAEDRSAYW
jgi:hypothetical protein